MPGFLLVIGHREGLSWILGSQRMAFPRLVSSVRSLALNDQLFLYTTRGCFRNPSRDEGRVVGRATVRSAVTALSAPVHVAGRTFPYGCAIHVDSLAPLRHGLALRGIVDELDAFRNHQQTWSVLLRRSLLPLSDHDVKVLGHGLASVAHSPTDVIEPYLKWTYARSEV
jgi:hypothetical protein